MLEEHFKADSAYRVAVNEPIPAAQDGSTFINDPNTPSKDQQASLLDFLFKQWGFYLSEFKVTPLVQDEDTRE